MDIPTAQSLDRPKGTIRGRHATAPSRIGLFDLTVEQRKQVLALVRAMRETNREQAVAS